MVYLSAPIDGVEARLDVIIELLRDMQLSSKIEKPAPVDSSVPVDLREPVELPQPIQRMRK